MTADCCVLALCPSPYLILSFLSMVGTVRMGGGHSSFDACFHFLVVSFAHAWHGTTAGLIHPLHQARTRVFFTQNKAVKLYY